MKILQLCSKPPVPAVDGGCVAMNAITSGLIANGHKVKVLAISTKKHPFEKQKIPLTYLTKTEIETVFVDTSLKISAGVKNIFSTDSYNVSRFYSKDVEHKLKEILQADKFDIVLFESLFVAPYLETVKANSDSKTVLRAHNVEHIIWEQLSRQTHNPIKKYYLHFLAKRLKNYELGIINRFSGVAAITVADKNYFKNNGCTIPVESFPLGIDAAHYKLPEKNKIDFPSLFHLGSMDWTPNEEGIKWFLENCWVKILTEFPDLKIYLAGRNMPEWLAGLEMKNVVIVGEVESSHDFIRSKSIMVVPLLSGGGMRVKIIEGMALGKAIVSTTVGAEGIDCSNGENILIADNPEQFVQQISKCVNDKMFYDSICLHARKQAIVNYDYKQIASRLSEFCKTL